MKDIIDDSSPFFSVIIPVYNKERTVARAIQSVLSQSYEDFELILVCDPSFDRSYEQICKFNDTRISVYSRSEPGPGGYAARNLGIEMAKGEWITFLDADDEWLPDRLLSHHNIIVQLDCSVVFSSWQDIYDDGSKSTPLKLEEGLLSAKFFFKIYGVLPRVIHTNTISCKKSIFDSVGGFPVGKYNRGGDVYTWLKIIDYSGYAYRSTQEVSVYHKEDSTVTKNHRPDLKGNAVYDMCNTIVSRNRLRLAYNFYVRRISNRHIRYALVDRIKVGDFNLRDLHFYRFWVAPCGYLKFFFFGLCPKLFRKRIVKAITTLS